MRHHHSVHSAQNAFSCEFSTLKSSLKNITKTIKEKSMLAKNNATGKVCLKPSNLKTKKTQIVFLKKSNQKKASDFVEV